MIKCSPIETRKNLDAAHAMAKAGIDFVAVPVIRPIDKSNLHEIVQNRFDFLDALTTKDTHGISPAKFKKATDTIIDYVENHKEKLDIRPAPEPFAKIFFSEKYGQLCATRTADNEQGAPEIRVFCEPHGLGVCANAVIFNDTIEGCDQQEKAFKELTLETAEAIVAQVFQLQSAYNLGMEK